MMSTKKINKKSEVAKVIVRDSMVNVLTGMGTPKDVKKANEWVKTAYDPELLDTIYSENWLARNCVDVPANDVSAKWRDICTPSLKPEQISVFKKFEKKLKINQKIREALRLARKYGGAAIYCAIEGQSVEEPLRLDNIRKGARVNFIVLNRNELGMESATTDLDEFSPNYNKPIFLRIFKSMRKVHISRFLIFQGPVMADDRNGLLADKFWGKSIFDSALIEAIERCESCMDSLARSLEGATVDMLKVPGLFARLADTEQTSLLRKRIAEGAMTKSTYKISLVDSEEEFVRAEATGSLSAGAQVLQLLLQIPAGATGIPVTKLLGISPGGLNATGESDSENYYTMLGSIRSNDIEQNIEIIDTILCKVLFGTDFADWAFNWESFWSSDKTQDATIESQRITEIIGLVQAQILPETVALRQLYEDGTFSALTEQDVKEFEDFENEESTDMTPEGTASEEETENQ